MDGPLSLRALNALASTTVPEYRQGLDLQYPVPQASGLPSPEMDALRAMVAAQAMRDPQAAAAAERRKRDEDERRKQEQGARAAMLAQLAATLPGFGATIGRLFDGGPRFKRPL